MDRMEQPPVLEQTASPLSAQVAPGESERAPFQSADGQFDPLRFPGEDNGRSLTEMAKRDLEATLQLLAERAQQVTGASGAAIALRRGAAMLCCASTGAAAPRVGASVETESGLAGESIRSRQILRCHDASIDPRVNGMNFPARGILSVMVMPLLRDQQVAGIFELVSEKANAFEDRDVLALDRLGEMIQTALDYADAANRVQSVIRAGGDAAWLGEAAVARPGLLQGIEPSAEVSPEPGAVKKPREVERGNIGKCGSCGFPVSEGRNLCLDCAAPQNSDAQSTAADPAFLSQLNLPAASQESWLQSHKYLLGTILLSAATLAIALWLR